MYTYLLVAVAKSTVSFGKFYLVKPWLVCSVELLHGCLPSSDDVVELSTSFEFEFCKRITQGKESEYKKIHTCGFDFTC